MQMPRAMYDEMVAHALQSGQDECCGVIATRDGVAVQLYRTENVMRTPKFGYVIDGRQLVKISMEIDDAGLDLGAIYHSHPRTDPVPSQADINLAQDGDTGRPLWPGTVYLIVGNVTSTPVVRAWEIDGDDVAEAELLIV